MCFVVPNASGSGDPVSEAPAARVLRLSESPMRRPSRMRTFSVAFWVYSFAMTLGASRLAFAQDPFASSQTQEPPSPPPQPDPSDWDPALPVPPGYHVEPHVRRNLIIRGAALTFLFYTFSAFAAASDRHERFLWIPVAGPFAQMSVTDSSNAPGLSALVASGLFQTLGAGLVCYGLLRPERRLVPNDVRPRIVSLLPIGPNANAAGLVLLGVF